MLSLPVTVTRRAIDGWMLDPWDLAPACIVNGQSQVLGATLKLRVMDRDASESTSSGSKLPVMDDASGAVNGALNAVHSPANGAHGPVNGVAAAYRPAPGYRRPFLARFVQYLLVTAALMVIGSVASIGYVVGSITAVIAVCYGVSYAWRGRFQTIVTPAGIEIRRYRNRIVPWSAGAGNRGGGLRCSKPARAACVPSRAPPPG